MPDAEKEQQEQQEKQRLDKLDRMLAHLFSKAFWDEAKLDPELYDDIFVDRKSEVATFERASRAMSGDPIIFIGPKGVGKSALLHKIRLMTDKRELFRDSTRELRTVMIDLDNFQPQSADELIRHAVVQFRNDYLDKITGRMPRAQLNDENLRSLTPMGGAHLLAQELRKLFMQQKDLLPYCLFFIDDLDYAPPKTWFDLAVGLSPILSFPFLSSVYAIRPDLAAVMFHCQDARVTRILGDAIKIEVGSLPLSEVITQRLLETAQETKKTWWKRVITRFWKSDDNIFELMEKVSLRKEGVFRYPFADKLENFLDKTTNGNARQMFQMIKTCLHYILKHKDTFLPGKDGRFHFQRDLIVILFGEYEGFPIVNLNSPRFLSHNKTSPERSGNPLLLHLLEWIGYCSGNEKRLMECFTGLGHTEDTMATGLVECEQNGLIELCRDAPTIDISQRTVNAFGLTPKGRFHLERLVTWEQYGSRFGLFKTHVRRMYFSRISDCAMYTDFLEFLVYLATAVVEKTKGKARTLGLSLTKTIDDFIGYHVRYFRVGEDQVDPTDILGQVYSPDSLNDEFMIDEDKVAYLLENPPIDVKLGDRKIITGKYVAHPDKKPHEYAFRLGIKEIMDAGRALLFDKNSSLATRERCDYRYFQGLADSLDWE